MTKKGFRQLLDDKSVRTIRPLLAGTGLECVEVSLPKHAKRPLRFRKDEDPRNQWVSFDEVKRILGKLGRL